jgi:hypothetical protein
MGWLLRSSGGFRIVYQENVVHAEGGTGMTRDLLSLGLKWLASWLVLLAVGLIYPGSGTALAAMAVLVAAALWLTDRALPFRVQGVTRWAMEGGLAALVLYAASRVAPVQPLPILPALVAGYAIGSVEIPMHFYLTARFGLRKRDDRRDGIG